MITDNVNKTDGFLYKLMNDHEKHCKTVNQDEF